MTKKDIELKMPMMKVKSVKKPAPLSPTAGHLREETPKKKITTRQMIKEALTELNTRKGVSLQAIKKYIDEHHDVKSIKNSYYIKKFIKLGVENGSIIQTKGVGASGSFRLAPKGKKEKKPKIAKVAKEKVDKPKKELKQKEEKIPKIKKKVTIKEKEDKIKPPKTTAAMLKKVKSVEKGGMEKKVKTKKMGKENKNVQAKTPSKMITVKRKSIGSIIKKPKMKPKSLKVVKK